MWRTQSPFGEKRRIEHHGRGRFPGQRAVSIGKDRAAIPVGTERIAIYRVSTKEDGLRVLEA